MYKGLVDFPLEVQFISDDFEQVVGHEEHHMCLASVHTCGEVWLTLYSAFQCIDTLASFRSHAIWLK